MRRWDEIALLGALALVLLWAASLGFSATIGLWWPAPVAVLGYLLWSRWMDR